MPTLQFMGRILPPVFEISSEVGTRITWNDKDGRGLSVIFDTQIRNSRLRKMRIKSIRS